ncbi:hypothetical protein [Streptomyces sp. NPDC056491]|uniref:hypothetical protein n=1 Tax=Streptomyces sp. NPDC056491 TaxID=3345837 RepID=UPI00369F206E
MKLTPAGVLGARKVVPLPGQLDLFAAEEPEQTDPTEDTATAQSSTTPEENTR